MQPYHGRKMHELVVLLTMVMVKDRQNDDDRRRRMSPVLEGQRHIDHRRA